MVNKNKQNPKNKISTQKVSRPIAVGTVVTNRGPNMHSAKGGFTVSHRERVMAINTSTSTAVGNIVAITPVGIDMFPWLSAIASGFTEYRFSKLDFQYIPGCSSTTTGALTLGVVDDPDITEVLNAEQLSIYGGAKRVPYWADAKVSVTNADITKRGTLFTKRPAFYGTTSNRLSVFGTLQTIASPSSVAAQVGEIYVEYTVHLFKPKFPDPVAAKLTLVGTDSANCFTGTQVKYGTTDLISASANTLQILSTSGYVFVEASFHGNSGSGISVTATGLAGNTAVNNLIGYNGDGQIYSRIYRFTGEAAATLTFDTTGFAGTYTGCEVLVTLVQDMTSSY